MTTFHTVKAAAIAALMLTAAIAGGCRTYEAKTSAQLARMSLAELASYHTQIKSMAIINIPKDGEYQDKKHYYEAVRFAAELQFAIENPNPDNTEALRSGAYIGSPYYAIADAFGWDYWAYYEEWSPYGYIAKWSWPGRSTEVTLRDGIAVWWSEATP